MNIWQYLRSLLPIDLSLCKHKDGSVWWMEVFKILTVFFLKAYRFYRNYFLSWGINFEMMQEQWYGMV